MALAPDNRPKRHRRQPGTLFERIIGNRWLFKGVFFVMFVTAAVRLLRFAARMRALAPSVLNSQEGYMKAFGWLESGNPATFGLAPATGRPEMVAGILPVGHFTSFFAWLKGGGWDTLLPAGLVIIIGALILSLFFKRGFCAWLCPLGTLWEACAAAGHKVLGRTFRLPTWLDYALRALRYVLAFGIFYWLFSVTLEEAVGFRTLPYMFIADVKIISSFGGAVFLALFALCAITSFFFGSVWCRYLCPLGGLYGPLSMASPATICRDADLCIDCSKCTQSCHALITIEAAGSVRSPECDGCMDCVHACPVQGALEMKVAHRFTIPAWIWPTLPVATWFIIYAIALATGNWHSPIPAETYAAALTTVGDSGGFDAATIKMMLTNLLGP